MQNSNPGTFKIRFPGFIGTAETHLVHFLKTEVWDSLSHWGVGFALCICLHFLMPVFLNLLSLNLTGTSPLSSLALDTLQFLITVTKGCSLFTAACCLVLFFLDIDWSLLTDGAGSVWLPGSGPLLPIRQRQRFDMELQISLNSLHFNMIDDGPYADGTYPHYHFDFADIQNIEISEQEIDGYRCLTIYGTATTNFPNDSVLRYKDLWNKLIGNTVNRFWLPESLIPDVVNALDVVYSQPEEGTNIC